MSKMSIEWHEECLKNLRHSVVDNLKEMLEAHARYFTSFKELQRYERQIKRAKKLGKDGFDRERFKDE